MTIKTPYAPSHGVNIPNLDPFFGPDAPPLPDPEPMPDAMQQNPHILYVMQILADVLTDRLDTFADTQHHRLLRPHRPQSPVAAGRVRCV